jgi:hypothetical protein
MNFIRYTFVFLLFWSTIHSCAMEKEEKQLSEDLYEALCDKCTYLKGSPQAHRTIRATLDWVRAYTTDKKQKNIYNFCERLIDDGFLKVPKEFLDIVNEIKYYPSNPEIKAHIETTYNYTLNTTLFFRKDAEEQNCDDNLSSDNFFKKLCRNPTVLNAYKAYKEKNNAKDKYTISKIGAENFYALISKYGIKFPVRSFDGSYSIPQFLELNKENLTIGNDAHYKKMEKLSRVIFIVSLTLESLNENKTEIEDRLTKYSEMLETNAQKIWYSQPKDACIIS